MNKTALSLLRSKYVLTLIAFIVWMLFVDRNNVITQIRAHKTLNQLRSNKQYFQDEIKKNRIATEELMTNTKNLEKFAREQYLMKKDNEDIFLIVKETTKK